MKRQTTKILRVGSILLAFYLLFYASALLPQPVRAQAMLASITGLNEPFDVALTPNGNYAYVADADGSVLVISTANNKVTASITVGIGP